MSTLSPRRVLTCLALGTLGKRPNFVPVRYGGDDGGDGDAWYNRWYTTLKKSLFT
jgi:hypothetical protein